MTQTKDGGHSSIQFPHNRRESSHRSGTWMEWKTSFVERSVGCAWKTECGPEMITRHWDCVNSGLGTTTSCTYVTIAGIAESISICISGDLTLSFRRFRLSAGMPLHRLNNLKCHPCFALAIPITLFILDLCTIGKHPLWWSQNQVHLHSRFHQPQSRNPRHHMHEGMIHQ